MTNELFPAITPEEAATLWPLFVEVLCKKAND